ncbi:UNVERIFIED_CONTAM: hypothetical protein Sradi_2507100 [Sesamum radiatum]|uniref:Uncharacterized protein n=1 Tax=Sesamum radiatum TaxID=300843 RepID=A0AAW2SK89_SESRA
MGERRRKGRNEIAIPGSGLLQKERRAATSVAQAFQQYQIRLYGKSRCEERFVMVFYIILHWGMKRSPTRAPTRITDLFRVYYHSERGALKVRSRRKIAVLPVGVRLSSLLDRRLIGVPSSLLTRRRCRHR